MDVEWGSSNVLSKPWFHDSDGLNNNKLANSKCMTNNYDCNNRTTEDNTNEDSPNVNCNDLKPSGKLEDCINLPMLGLLQNQPEVSRCRIPMDFSPYLLPVSASSDFDLKGYSTKLSNGYNGLIPSCNISTNYKPCSRNDDTLDNNVNLNKRRNGPLKSIIIKSDTTNEADGDSLCPESPLSPSRVAKKVSFADHKGLALAQVRLVKEGPDEPPHLNPSILSSLTEGAIADVTFKPPIKLCFSQPASDFLAFRDKVNKNLVLLENVMLKDYTVEGTIKVKNISFEKRVFVRLSLDEWETFEDVDATYVPGPGLGFSDSLDTFSFKIDIPPTFDVSKKIQFAVCFEENGNQHWDNNDGENYCIVSENYEGSMTSGLVCNPRWLPDKRTEDWTEFSVCRDLDTSSPYY